MRRFGRMTHFSPRDSSRWSAYRVRQTTGTRGWSSPWSQLQGSSRTSRISWSFDCSPIGCSSPMSFTSLRTRSARRGCPSPAGDTGMAAAKRGGVDQQPCARSRESRAELPTRVARQPGSSLLRSWWVSDTRSRKRATFTRSGSRTFGKSTPRSIQRASTPPRSVNVSGHASLASRCEPGVEDRVSVVLAIVESLSAYHSKLLSGLHDYTPNLDRLAGRGTYFTHFFANGYSTEGGEISLLTGHVPLHTAGSRGSIMAFTDVEGDFHRWLAKEGYETAFFTSASLSYGELGRWHHAIGIEEVDGAESPFYNGMPRGPFGAAEDAALIDRFLQWHDHRRAEGQALHGNHADGRVPSALSRCGPRAQRRGREPSPRRYPARTPCRCSRFPGILPQGRADHCWRPPRDDSHPRGGIRSPRRVRAGADFRDGAWAHRHASWRGAAQPAANRPDPVAAPPDRPPIVPQ